MSLGTFTEAAVQIRSGDEHLAGTLSLPAGAPAPGVLLLGGTFSDLRDGDADPVHRPDIPPHGLYRRLAVGLADAGLAVLRFDRRGCGESGGERPDRATEIADAAAAWAFLDAEPRVGGAAAMVGESAGAYVLCRLCASGARPRAAVLQGALHRSIAGLIEFNGRRARAFYDRGPEARAWLWQEARREYESALVAGAMASALDRGQLSTVTGSDARVAVVRSLDDLADDLEHPPADQFRHVGCPVLVLHGGDDLNVPVDDALATVASLRAAGNRDVEAVILAAADHSLQQTPDDPEERTRERLSFESFRRPYHPRYPAVVVEFLARRLLTSAS